MLRISRVIFTLTANAVYLPYWDIVSRVWNMKFGVIPTLIFNGSQEDMASCNLSEKHGEIVRLDSVPEVVLNRDRDWSCTWSLFYGATLFPGGNLRSVF